MRGNALWMMSMTALILVYEFEEQCILLGMHATRAETGIALHENRDRNRCSVGVGGVCYRWS